MPNTNFHHGFAEQRLCMQMTEGLPERPTLRSIIERTRSSLGSLRSRIMGNDYLRRPEARVRPAERVEGVRTDTRGLMYRLLNGAADRGVRTAQRIARSPIVQTGIVPTIAVNDLRVQSAAEEIRTRRDLAPDALAKYHRELLHAPGEPETEAKMFQYFPGSGPEPRKLAVFVLGNRQRFSNGGDDGMRYLQQRFAARPDVDVLLFRSGNAGRDVRGAASGTADVNGTTAVTMAHIENVVHARLHARGMFAGQRPPSGMVMAGFSFGGGVVEELSDRWNGMGSAVPVHGVALLDPIRLGARNLGEPVTRRPAIAGRVYHAYQTSSLSRRPGAARRGISVHGAPLADARPGDVVQLVRDAGHREMQNTRLHRTDVLDPAFDFLNGSIR